MRTTNAQDANLITDHCEHSSVALATPRFEKDLAKLEIHTFIFRSKAIVQRIVLELFLGFLEGLKPPARPRRRSFEKPPRDPN